jgi:hypothetical protein
MIGAVLTVLLTLERDDKVFELALMRAGIILTDYYLLMPRLLCVSFNLTGNLRQGRDVLSGDCGAANM